MLIKNYWKRDSSNAGIICHTAAFHLILSFIDGERLFKGSFGWHSKMQNVWNILGYIFKKVTYNEDIKYKVALQKNPLFPFIFLINFIVIKFSRGPCSTEVLLALYNKIL